MQLFIYFSEILGRKVADSNYNIIGKLCDLSMSPSNDVFPRADAIVIKKGFFRKKMAFIPMGDVQKFGKTIVLKIDQSEIKFESLNKGCEFSLGKVILDQQVVDINDQKVVRVNDVHLLNVDSQLYLAHVDVGLRGLVRRLGWSKFIDTLVKFFSPQSPYLTDEELISWKSTHVLAVGKVGNVLRSDVARQKLARIPTVELADIMEDLDVFEKLSLFKTFNADMQHRVFADMAPHEKEELIEQLDDKEASHLLENIPADEATDLLHDLPPEKRRLLFRHMHSKTSKELRKLLGFAQDSAGGLMTTEYLTLDQDDTVADAIQKIKDNTDFAGNIVHLYVVGEKQQLLGATSLRRFINEDPKKKIIDTVYPNNIFVRTDDGMEEIALLLEKYKFSSIPVLDEANVIQGVITSDDVMEELISLTWTKYKDQI